MPIPRVSVFPILLAFGASIISSLYPAPLTKPARAPVAKEKSVKNQVYSYALNLKGRVIIENEVGEISVESWEKPNVEISVFKTSTAQENFDRIKIEVESQPDRLKLKTIILEKLKGENAVDYVVSVPPTVDLQLKTTSGKIQVKDTMGRVSLSAEKGEFQLKNVAGSIEGKIETGNIIVEMKNPITNDVTLKIDDGPIRFSLPPLADAFLWAESDDGVIKNNLHFQASYSGDQKAVKGQLGKGGKLVHLQTTRGTIDLVESSGASVAEKKAPNDTDKSLRSGSQPTELVPKSPQQLIAQDVTRPNNKPQEPPPNFQPKALSPPSTISPQAKAESMASGDAVYKVNTNLISLNANVRDRASGKSMTNLQQGDFLIYEDNVLQQISYFSSVETPFHLLLLLDISGSMEEKFDILQEASIKFTRMLKPQDKIAIATFNHQFQLVSDFTDDRRALARSILGIEPGGGTAFYDALLYVMKNLFRGIKERKAIIIFTDGADNQHMPDQYENGSVTTFRELFRLIEETDVTIYPIFLNTEGDPKSGVDIRGDRANTLDDILDDIFGVRKRRRNAAPPQKRRTKAGVEVYSDLYANAIDELYQIAEQTGGRMYAPTDIKDLNGIYEQIVDDLSIQFSLGYYPTNSTDDGRWRRITVKVKDRPGVAIRTRKGYYANFSSNNKGRWAEEIKRDGKRRIF